MFQGLSVYRLVAFATSLALSALVICQTTSVSLAAAPAGAMSPATIA